MACNFMAVEGDGPTCSSLRWLTGSEEDYLAYFMVEAMEPIDLMDSYGTTETTERTAGAARPRSKR